jgi:hypothetical protein
MEAVVKHKYAKKNIDWIIPATEAEVTLEDYRNEMKSAELSEKFTFEQYYNCMNKWLTENL